MRLRGPNPRTDGLGKMLVDVGEHDIGLEIDALVLHVAEIAEVVRATSDMLGNRKTGRSPREGDTVLGLSLLREPSRLLKCGLEHIEGRSAGQLPARHGGTARTDPPAPCR